MKRNTLFVLIVFLCCTSFMSTAQSQRTVEVTISDTINLKATSFTYKISAGGSNSTKDAMSSMFAGESADEGEYSLQIDTVEQLLKKGHYHYSFDFENKYTLSKPGKPSTIMVMLNSEAELDGLCKKLSVIQGLKGKIQSVNYENPDQHLPAMFARLYSTATKQATELATISGSTIGKVIAITEVQIVPVSATPYESMMSELMKKMLLSGLYDATPDMTQSYARKMSFRFELK